MADIIYFVIPCYNEEDVLPLTAEKLSYKMRLLIKNGLAKEESRILLVDDGSKDKTWQLIEELSNKDNIFTGLKLSHNKGHQNALLAGLMTAKEYADAVISMDADLQDDVGAVDAFLKAYYDGCDIVYGVRSSREKDSFFKRATALGFYQLMRAMGTEMVSDHADYRLMSKRALDCLAQYKEVNLFLRGIVPQIGLKYTYVYYERGKRAAGTSKYPLKKMFSFALDGITSFSVKPLRLITSLGLIVTCLSVVVFVAKLAAGFGADMASSLWTLGGIELLALGIVGEYIGKIYSEVKGRPRYLIEKNLCEETMQIHDFSAMTDLNKKTG
ncbi:MAG: glycosyltransferase family 2 protein [Bacillota bacterium]|nr:glycosyltransferase family 2 protein [Bacillota bacterium]